MWESQREESKQVRINDIETSFFPTIFRANTMAADLKNAINTIRKSLVKQPLTYRVMIK